MNQYPAGFVPMMVPQPYMAVAMPTAIPMSGAVGPGLPALSQVLHPQVAAAHVQGAPVVTSSVVNASGITPGMRQAQLSQAVGQLAQGMGQLPQGLGQLPQGMGQLSQGMGQLPQGMGQLPQGMAQLPQGMGQFPQGFGQLPQGMGQFGQGIGQAMGLHGIAGMHQTAQSPVSIPTAKVIPQIPANSASPDSRKRFGDQDKGKGGRFGNRWQPNPEQDIEELNVDESLCVLDHYNSDLNLVIDPDGCGASVLLNPPGFCFTWAGARATYGVCKGKVFYEVHILEHLPVDFGEDHQEQDPHVVRVGWSIDSSSFQLGEEPWSFGFGGTAKFSTNCRFSDYGQRFGAGDVIGCLLDLDSRPATMSFVKNGIWLGVALPLHGFPVGSKDMALYPHVLLKNCRVKVNFGQQDPWFPPLQGFAYIGQLPLAERVRGLRCPERKADCEMIMIVGLPGVGKTTWGINMQKSHPEKRYNIIGTDTLIDKMRVMGLPRKRNYHGRWDVLIDKASKCLNKFFQIASRRKRNFILDQTNVYGSARRRKMKNFNGFYRIAAVIQPDDPEMMRRSRKRTVEDGKFVPESAVMEMKANFCIPEERDNLFDRIDFIELPREKVIPLVEQYVREGQEKRPPRDEVYPHDNRYQKQDKTPRYGQGGSGAPLAMDQQPMMGGGSKAPGGGQQMKPEPQWYGGGAGLLGQAPDLGPMGNKRIKLEAGLDSSRQQAGALDLLKEQYDEAEQQDAAHWGQGMLLATSAHSYVKEEPRWTQAQPESLLGASLSMHGGHLPPHLAHHGALMVSPPPGALSLAGGLGAQPPPPPPPVLPGQLAHTAAGPAIVALAHLPPPGPPPTMLAVGGMGGLGAVPPGFMHQQAESAGQLHSYSPPDWHQAGLPPTSVSNPSPFQQSSTSPPAQRGIGQQQDEDKKDWQQQQQQPWQRQQDRSGNGQKNWQTSDNGAASKWQQNPARGDDRARAFDQRGKFDGSGGAGDASRPGGYDSQSRNYQSGDASGDSSSRRFDDFSRPPPSMGGSDRSDDYRASDNRSGKDYRNSGHSFSDANSDRWSSTQPRGGDRWNPGSRQDRAGQDAGDNRWSGGSRQEGRGSNDGWSGEGTADRSDRRDHNDRWGSRGMDSSLRRDRDQDRDRSGDRGGRDRDLDRDRDSYRDMDNRDREDSSEPRQRRRKSKWDQQEEDSNSSKDPSAFDGASIKQEPESSGYGGPKQPSSSFQADQRQQQYYDRPDPYSRHEPGSSFPPRGMDFNKPPPSSGQGNFSREHSSELPSLLDVQFAGRPAAPPDQQEEAEKADGAGTSLLGPVPSAPPPKFPAKAGDSSQASEDLPNTSVPPPFANAQPGGPGGRGGPGGPSRPERPGGPGLGPGGPRGAGPGGPAGFGGPSGPGLGGASRPGGPGGPGLLGGPTGGGRGGPPGGQGINRPFQPGPRFSGGEGGAMGRGHFPMDGPPRHMRPRNPQNFNSPQMSGPGSGMPPNAPWNQNRFGGGGNRGGMPPRPRFDGGGPGGGRFPGGPGPMRWPRGPR